MRMAEPIERDAEAAPDDGVAMLTRVAWAILDGADARQIGRTFQLAPDKAQKLHAEVFRQVYQSIEDDYGRDRLKAHKYALEQRLNKGIDVCMREMEETGSSRPLARMTAAIKVLCSMQGHNAPTQTVNTDIRVHASVQPKDMGRVMADPRARRAMLEFEQAVSDLGDAARPIDVTPGDDAGGDE
jgi:hypothetical protein